MYVYVGKYILRTNILITQRVNVQYKNSFVALIQKDAQMIFLTVLIVKLAQLSFL